MMEVASTPQESVNYQTTRRNIPEESRLQCNHPVITCCVHKSPGKIMADRKIVSLVGYGMTKDK
jgi:hypothetical protein